MRFHAVLMLVFTVALLVYLPGLSGGFVFDDASNLLVNELLRRARPTWASLWEVMNSGNAGPLKRPLSMASFAVNVWLTGMDPFYFKLTNVFIHLLNGFLIYRLTRRLLEVLVGEPAMAASCQRLRWSALAVAAMWVLHPLQLSSVLYAVQRMNSLAALFCLLGMLSYAVGRHEWRVKTRSRRGTGLVMLGFGCTIPAMLAKENGLLLPIFLFLIEWLFFRFSAASQKTVFVLRQAYLWGVGIPLLVALTWQFGWHFSDLVAAYGGRDFTLLQRVLTEPRILWWYVRWLLVPDITQYALYHDDIPLSQSLFAPPTTFFSLLEWLLLAGVAVGLGVRRKVPALAFGLSFFLVGHSLESSVFPLEIVHEHRNYLPSFGIFFMLGYYLVNTPLGAMAEKWGGTRLAMGSGWLKSGSVVVFTGLLAVATFQRALVWSDEKKLVTEEVKHHPYSARSAFAAARTMLLLAEHYDKDSAERRELLEFARAFYRHANGFDNYHLLGRFGLLAVDTLDGRPYDHALLQELEDKLKNGPLSATSRFTLIRILQDEVKNRWNLPSEVVFGAVDAILQNPRLDHTARLQILASALNLAFARKEYEPALRIARAQVSLAPQDPVFRLNLAQALFLRGDRAGAMQEIQVSEHLDVTGALKKQRQRIGEEISKR